MSFIGRAADNRRFNHGYTFASHSLAAAVGIAVIATFSDEDILGKGLSACRFARNAHCPCVRGQGQGLLWGLVSYRNWIRGDCGRTGTLGQVRCNRLGVDPACNAYMESIGSRSGQIGSGDGAYIGSVPGSRGRGLG